MNKYENYLGTLEHELESSDILIERFKELHEVKETLPPCCYCEKEPSECTCSHDYY